MYHFARFLYWLLGWKWESKIPADLKKYVLVAVPHTSNWDFFYAVIAFQIMRVPIRFTIKDSVMVFPINYILSALGAIPINRKPLGEGEKRQNMVYAMSEMFQDRDEIVVLVTPEGTRHLRKQWKLGFYHTALRANVPIALSHCNFRDKEIGINYVLYPTGDIEKDMREIMDYYRPLINLGKNPELSCLDERYS